MKHGLTIWCALVCALLVGMWMTELLCPAPQDQDTGPAAIDDRASVDLAAGTLRDPPLHDDRGRGAGVSSSSTASPGVAVRTTSAAAPISLGSLNLLHASEEYHPTRERFMALAGSIHFALDASPEDLAEAGPGPWQKFDLPTLRRELLPERELDALWTLPDTKALWRIHQTEFLAQSNLLILLDHAATPSVREALEKELAATRGRLDSLRLSIWNDPAYQALYLLAKELR